MNPIGHTFNTSTNIPINGISNLKIRRANYKEQNQEKKMVLAGAGPAGLMRALLAASLGYSVQIFEKRPEQRGRENIVALDISAIHTLKEFGVYQYLVKQKLIFPGSYDIRVCDLEAALKHFIKEIIGSLPIEYESEIQEIEDDTVTIKTGNLSKKYHPDILVIAEGGKSSTNELLGLKRTDFLARLPVIAAIFKDHRPVNPHTVKQKFRKFYLTLSYKISFAAHLTHFLFALFLQNLIVFQFKRTTAHPKSKIAGALLLATPGQNYCGVALNSRESEKLLSLQNRIKHLQSQNQQKKAEKIEKVFKRRLNTFANHAYFASFLFNPSKRRWMPLVNTQWIEIGADRVEKCSLQKGKMVILEAGDALATVDPASGQGCSTALSSVEEFETFLKDRDASQYNNSMENRIQKIHRICEDLRKLYRPDRVYAKKIPQ